MGENTSLYIFIVSLSFIAVGNALQHGHKYKIAMGGYLLVILAASGVECHHLRIAVAARHHQPSSRRAAA